MVIKIISYFINSLWPCRHNLTHIDNLAGLYLGNSSYDFHHIISLHLGHIDGISHRYRGVTGCSGCKGCSIALERGIDHTTYVGKEILAGRYGIGQVFETTHLGRSATEGIGLLISCYTILYDDIQQSVFALSYNFTKLYSSFYFKLIIGIINSGGLYLTYRTTIHGNIHKRIGIIIGITQ